MQTFLPYSDFKKSAECLDMRRLGKQRVEAFQLLNILLGRTQGKGWINHPAALMWRGYEDALKAYFNIIVNEWVKRGYKNNMLPEESHHPLYIKPPWLGDERFHAAHRSNLLRKKPEHYSKFNWEEPDNLPYFWPTEHEYK